MLGGLQEKVREVSDNTSPSKSSTGYASSRVNIAYKYYSIDDHKCSYLQQ